MGHRQSLAEAGRADGAREAEELYNLGLAYSTGAGVSTDLVTAHKWFNIAATLGYESARDYRAQLAQEMTAGQIALAQRLARQWLSAHRAH